MTGAYLLRLCGLPPLPPPPPLITNLAAILVPSV